jgi:hypothetical protein
LAGAGERAGTTLEGGFNGAPFYTGTTTGVCAHAQTRCARDPASIRPAGPASQIEIGDAAALLLSTTLATTLLIAAVIAPTPAHAVTDCLATAQTGSSPDPIFANVGDSIICVNTEPRVGNATYNDAIYLRTSGAGPFDIYLNNSGPLTSYYDGHGIVAYAVNGGEIEVINTGDIETYRAGILAYTRLGDDSPITITNSGNISGTGYNGIRARARGGNGSYIKIFNSGDVTFTQNAGTGVYAKTYFDKSDIYIFNSGALSGVRTGILALTGNNEGGDNSPIEIVTTGEIHGQINGP